jgi:hypothetical protein
MVTISEPTYRTYLIRPDSSCQIQVESSRNSCGIGRFPNRGSGCIGGFDLSSSQEEESPSYATHLIFEALPPALTVATIRG